MLSGLSGSRLAVLGQEVTSPKLKFEAESVRKSAPGVNRTDIRISPSTMIYNGMTLRLLIRTAWHIQDVQIVGGPSWLDSARFDITAKLDKPHPPPEMIAMLRNLLEERFGLVVVPERRAQSHYSLVQSGSKEGKHTGLIRTNEDECPPEAVQFNKPSKSDPATLCGGVRISTAGNSAQFAATSIPMSQFALSLTGVMNSWVENETDLEGNYDIKVSWPLAIEANAGSEGVPPDPTFIFGALQNELGLKLEPVKGPVPVYVVQRAEMPSEN